MRDAGLPNRRLSDLAKCRVTFDCGLCSRHGATSGGKLLNEFGDMAMGGLVVLYAAAHGCQRAQQEQAIGLVPGAGRCRIRYEAIEPIIIARPMLLGVARDQGWQLSISCNSRHSGLKAKKPCLGRVSVDLQSLVVALGPWLQIVGLENKLSCPTCGRLGVTLYWTLPGGAAAMRA